MSRFYYKILIKNVLNNIIIVFLKITYTDFDFIMNLFYLKSVNVVFSKKAKKYKIYRTEELILLTMPCFFALLFASR